MKYGEQRFRISRRHIHARFVVSIDNLEAAWIGGWPRVTASQADLCSEGKHSLCWPKNPSDALRQRMSIHHAKLPQAFDDQRSFDRRHNWLNERCFEQAGGLPIANADLV